METRAEFINRKQQLMTESWTACQNIPTGYIEDLCATIPGRLIDVLKMKCNLAKYWSKIGIYKIYKILNR